MLKGNNLETVKESMIINFSEYNINDAVVSQTEYEDYINSISYPEMLNKDSL